MSKESGAGGRWLKRQKRRVGVIGRAEGRALLRRDSLELRRCQGDPARELPKTGC